MFRVPAVLCTEELVAVAALVVALWHMVLEEHAHVFVIELVRV